MTKEVRMIHKCLGCGAESDYLTNVTSDDGPSPGDITICLYCGQPMAFADDLSLRPLNHIEKVIIEHDPRFIEMEKEREKVMREYHKRNNKASN